MMQERRRRAQATHTDDWLMTYADTITLLLCLFVVLLCVTVAHKQAAPQPAPPPPPPSQAFVPTDTMEGNLPLHGVERAARRTTDDDDAEDEADEDAADRRPVRARLLRSGAAMASRVVAAAMPPVVPPASPPAAEGERIVVLEMTSASFFDSGSAILREGGRAILRGVATELGAAKYAGYEITVEGHTDDTPISTAQFPSNWELSTARAAAVVHFLLDQGLPGRRLRAEGYADSFPVAPNRDEAGRVIPENQARNRRVVIKLEKTER